MILKHAIHATWSNCKQLKAYAHIKNLKLVVRVKVYQSILKRNHENGVILILEVIRNSAFVMSFLARYGASTSL